MPTKASSRQRGRRQRGGHPPDSLIRSILSELGWSDLSWPIFGWTLLFLALGFGPLLIATVTGAVGVTRHVLVALGPVLICLAFAWLTWVYGMRYRAEIGRSEREIWLLVGLFVALAGLAGWALFVYA